MLATDMAELEATGTMADITQSESKKLKSRSSLLAKLRAELEAARTVAGVTQCEVEKLEPRLSFSPKLPTSVLLSIVGQLGKKAGERAACVKLEWRDVVMMAKALGMYMITVLGVAVGGDDNDGFSVVCLTTGVFSCGGDAEYVDDEDEDDSLDEDGFDKLTELSIMPELGHGGGGMVPEPRKIEALTGMDVIGVAAGFCRMAVWTGGGELFTFGYRPPGGQPHMVGTHGWYRRPHSDMDGQWRALHLWRLALREAGSRSHRGRACAEAGGRIGGEEGGWCRGRNVSHRSVD